MRRGSFGESVAHCKVWGLSAVSCAETAEPINLPFGSWTWVGWRKHKFNHIRKVAQMCTMWILFTRWHQCTWRHLCRELCKNGWTHRFAIWIVDWGWPKEAQFNCICQMAPMCPHGKAHWRYLANTIEPVIGDDAVLCQITLTTCYWRYWHRKAGVKGSKSLPLGVQWWMKEGWGQVIG